MFSKETAVVQITRSRVEEFHLDRVAKIETIPHPRQELATVLKKQILVAMFT